MTGSRIGRRDPPPADAEVRPAAVAGSFYPAHPERLRALVETLLEESDHAVDARGRPPSAGLRSLAGLLVPHAGLEFSGTVAAAGWRLLDPREPGGGPPAPPTIVILGTNHRAAWLEGIAAWEAGAWRTPLGDLAVDEDLAGAIVGLGAPFGVDRVAHLGEHSIEVQVPFIQALVPGARIVPLAVALGTGPGAVAAGEALGRLLAERRSAGDPIRLAISSDMAHYPATADCARATDALLAPILAVDAMALARHERALVERGVRGLVCGMCGIEPAVVGLAALRAMGAGRGVSLAAATSTDAGGPPDRAVGYLAAAFGS